MLLQTLTDAEYGDLSQITTDTETSNFRKKGKYFVVKAKRSCPYTVHHVWGRQSLRLSWNRAASVAFSGKWSVLI